MGKEIPCCVMRWLLCLVMAESFCDALLAPVPPRSVPEEAHCHLESLPEEIDSLRVTPSSFSSGSCRKRAGLEERYTKCTHASHTPLWLA